MNINTVDKRQVIDLTIRECVCVCVLCACVRALGQVGAQAVTVLRLRECHS